jgi:hypothetical protein
MAAAQQDVRRHALQVAFSSVKPQAVVEASPAAFPP